MFAALSATVVGMKHLTPTLAVVLLLALAADAKPKRKSPIDEVRAEVEALRAQVAELRAMVDDLQKQLDEAREPGAKGAIRPDPDAAAKARIREAVRAGVRDGRVVVGMTTAQARAALAKGKIKYMNYREEHAMVRGRSVTTGIWEPGAFYEGYVLIMARGDVVVRVEH